MKVPLTLWVEDAAVQHLTWLAEQLSQKRNTRVNKAGAVEWLAQKHAKRVQKTIAKNGDGSAQRWLDDKQKLIS